ncbi:phosphoribosylamine--glycine ligase [Acidianus sulfidivorans JP7]|uniref:phosphoribosylamine--glycine ligase n=1 Tax=Acidianus sulfidivorans JP7 TaxID=619593 RepID=A0A2U9INH1_9CREN|nr:phosphoribosylamine--glycine ligase [Acidianus sulfidivorans]AWR97555.1 phosphoribosylamine--glycine ligase [Acidianus sulfidivorans JP7]
MGKVLVIGDGAREHALASTLTNYTVFAISSFINPGIKEIVEKTNGKYFIGDINSPDFVKKVISEVNPDFGVIGPEDVLFNGVSDVFYNEGIPVVGPSKKDAEIERSKAWMRQLMWKYNIPGRLRFKSFSNLEDAAKFILDYGGSVAIKPSEQVGGKGVKVVADLQAYLSQDKREALSKSVGEIGSLVKDNVKIIIEERVDGPEYTLHVLTDGYSYLPLPLAQDYKHAYQDGIGPETGGMGSISGPDKLLPFINEDEYEKSFEIVKLTAKAIENETGVPYNGFISGQMMLTELWGPTIIEYYSRMGDPETASIIPRINSDFGNILELVAERKLSKAKLEVNSELVSITRAIAPYGYPLNKAIAKGQKFYIDLEKIREKGCILYFGSVALTEGQIVSQGSRALELVALARSYEEASKKLDQCMAFISSDRKMVYRKDIGNTINEMIEKAEIVRYSYKNREKKNLLGVSADWSPNGGLW